MDDERARMRAFDAKVTALLRDEAERSEISEPRDLTSYDATIAAVVQYGAIHGLTVEQTLTKLVIRLAVQKRELIRTAEDLMARVTPMSLAEALGLKGDEP